MILPADTPTFIGMLTNAEALAMADAISAEQYRERYFKFEDLYPEAGPLSRHNYPKHMEFFEAGASYRERCAMCANRIGKTFGMGGYEFTCHITGIYPKWWVGHRFHKPIETWAAGDTNQTTRDVIQKTLFGEIDYSRGAKGLDETGLVPLGLIDLDTIIWKSGFYDLVDTIKVKHVSGGYSTVGLKSYEQGRKAFQGTSQDLIWVDEEPPQAVYGEMLMRTMTTDGLTMLTYTPLEGLTGTVLLFMPEELRPPEDVIASLG